jgi:hypothetical protein
MRSASFAAARWRIRAAIRRQLAIDLRRLREMEQEIAALRQHIDDARARLAALA